MNIATQCVSQFARLSPLRTLPTPVATNVHDNYMTTYMTTHFLMHNCHIREAHYFSINNMLLFSENTQKRIRK